MKRITLIIIIILAISQLSFGQLNAINNLEWEHWYVCPNNYYFLSWDLPDASADTLIGYNIYRETELYTFQTETSLYHTSSGGNCGDDFVWYNGGDSFWMHVTAVYNSTQQESIYLDSANCYGYAIGIEERIQSKLNLYPNPTSGRLKIDSELDIGRIAIINQSGKIVSEFNNPKELDLSNYPKGVYIFKAWTEKDVISKVIVLE